MIRNGSLTPTGWMSVVPARPVCDSGGGIHFCLGAQLSRIETAIALDVLLHRFPSLELVDINHPAWKSGISLRGLDVLPAHWS